MAEMDIHKGGNMMLNSTEINGNSSTGFSNGILYFSNLLENLSDAFIATDADFNIIQWNKAAELIYGWKAAQVIGLPIAEVLKTEYLMGSSDDAVQQIELKGVWNNRVIQSRKNGEKISVYSTVSAVKDDDGKLVGLAAINRDITDRKSGTDNFDRDFALSLLSSDQDAIYEIEEALKRIEKNTYGICELTGRAIPRARLDAIPWTRFTVEAQAQLEREGALRQRRLGALGSVDSAGVAEVEEEEEVEEKPAKEKES